MIRINLLAAEKAQAKKPALQSGQKMVIGCSLILIAALVGALVGAMLILFRGRSRATPIPFGPFLAAAGWIMLMWGPALVSAYIGLYARPG